MESELRCWEKGLLNKETLKEERIKVYIENLNQFARNILKSSQEDIQSNSKDSLAKEIIFPSNIYIQEIVGRDIIFLETSSIIKDPIIPTLDN